jgi:hypothetical protein
MSLQLEKQRDFLFQAYFGANGNEFDLFISRAYRDMNRTLRGFRKLPENLQDEIFAGAKEKVKDSFEELRGMVSDEPEGLGTAFDDWHSKSCNELKKHYAEKIGSSSRIRITYGQAQKWLNMTMKYCWVCGNDPQLGPWFAVAHMPIDRIIIEAIKAEKVSARLPRVAWSKWDDENEYKDLQTALRHHAGKEGKSSLELEFEWWPKYNLMQAKQT